MKSTHAWLRRLPMLLGVVFSLLIVLAIYLLKDKFQKPPQTKKIVQQITMLQPPPPPPPPPPEQKPPEPEVKEEKIEEPQPEPEPEPTPEESNEPPAAELGLDAEGSAGADGFGLVGHKGGRSILGGGGGNAIIWYGGQIQKHVEDGLQSLLNDTAATKSDYSVLIEVWVDAEGRITRTELASGSGKADIDQIVRGALAKLRVGVGKPPPENMPQPIKIRLTSRG